MKVLSGIRKNSSNTDICLFKILAWCTSLNPFVDLKGKLLKTADTTFLKGRRRHKIFALTVLRETYLSGSVFILFLKKLL
jgi:hypothetical protein